MDIKKKAYKKIKRNTINKEGDVSGHLHLKKRFIVNKMGRYQSGQMGRAVNPQRQRFGGSNPSLPIFSGNSSVGRASAFQAVGRGFESRFPLNNVAHVAQLVEHVLGKDGVTSSNLVVGFVKFLEV